jgi:hypothetical protein
MLKAARTDTVLEIPAREDWPVPDLYSVPLSSHPIPFLVRNGGILHHYPNPPRGVMYVELGVGFQCPDQLTVRFERGSRSASRQGSPGPGISARLRDCT